MAGKHRSISPTAAAIMRNGTIDLADARKLLVEIERAESNRKTRLRALAQAVAVEIAIGEAELQSVEQNAGATDDFILSLAAGSVAADAAGIIRTGAFQDRQSSGAAFRL